MIIKNKKAFTLVELIIVITILAILATIGFMSYQSYIADSRDGKRKADLGEIRTALELYQAKKSVLPDPDIQTVSIMSGTNTISLQGYIGANVLKTLRATSDIKDTSDNNYYSYTVNGDKTKYQLLSMLENSSNLAMNNNLINETYATDYTFRYAYTVGNKVGIFFSGITNTPLQNSSSGNMDLTTTYSGTIFKVIFTNGTTNSGTIISTGVNLPAQIQTITNSTASTLNNGGGNIIHNIGDNMSTVSGETALYVGVYTGGHGKTIWIAGTESNLTWKDTQTTTLNASNNIDGRQNTGTFNTSYPASNYCQNLTRAGYSDWYLPASNNAAGTTIDCRNQTGELQFLYCNDGGLGNHKLGFSDNRYWSSSEYNASFTKMLKLASGTRDIDNKLNPHSARCIRIAD